MNVTVKQTKYAAYQRARSALYAMTKDAGTKPVDLAEQRAVVLEMHWGLFYCEGLPERWVGVDATIETPHPLG